MRVCDEGKEDCCLWVQRGSSWKDAENEGPQFKIVGYVKMLADTPSNTPTHKHRFPSSLSLKKESMR